MTHPGLHNRVKTLGQTAAPALLMALVLASHRELSLTLALNWWHNDTLNPGLLIIPTCVWLFFTNRQPLRRVSPWWPGLLLFLAAGVLILLGQQTHTQAVAEIGLLASLLLIPITLYGWQFLRSYWFVFAFALFAFPVWSVITPYAQLLTTHATVTLLSLTSLPIYAEGFSIQIPAGTFLVEEGCSGMRYLISALAIGSLYVHLSAGRWPVKLGMFLLLAALAVFGNWIRILIVIAIANYWGITHPMVDDHATIGWIIFAVLLLAWFVLGSRVLPTIAASAARRVKLTSLVNGHKHSIATLLLLVVTVALPAASNKLLAEPQFHPVLIDDLLPPTWERVTNGSQLEPHFPGAIQALYSSSDSTTLIYLIFYQQQTDGAELINETNSNFNPDRWELLERSQATHALAGANQSTAASTTETLTVNEQVIKNRADQRYLVWSWYEFGTRRTPAPMMGKIYGLWSRFDQSNGSLAVVIANEITVSPSDSRNRLLTDLQLVWPDLKTALQDALAP